MGTEYVDLPEAEGVAKTVILQFKTWPDIPKIKFLMKSSNKSTFNARISKTTGKWKYLTNFDYVMEIWDHFWLSATFNQKEALIFHELKHIAFKEDEETGEVIWKLQKHDIEEFIDVVAQYGAWHSGLVEFQAKLNSARVHDDPS